MYASIVSQLSVTREALRVTSTSNQTDALVVTAGAVMKGFGNGMATANQFRPGGVPQVYFTVTQVAFMTNLSESFIYREISAGRLNATRFGRAIRVKRSALKPWVDALNER